MEWLLINPFVPFQVPGLSKIAKYAELYTGSDPRWDDYTNQCIMRRGCSEKERRSIGQMIRGESMEWKGCWCPFRECEF